MILDGASLLATLAGIETDVGSPREFVVAFSGGVDSTMLLALLAEAPRKTPLRAVHVNHQLQPDAADWESHCADQAARFGIDLDVRRVRPDLAAGRGPEAAARDARYAALADCLGSGSWLLSGHHLDDQIETLLLNLLRGSGVDGLAAMPAARRLGAGWLVRPLLGVTRGALEQAATQRKLAWIEDPSNAERDADRNYLRHDVLPVLRHRWPNVTERLSGSVNRAAEARQLLADLGDLDLAGAGSKERLSVPALRRLGPARQRNALRSALRALGLPLPTGRALDSLLRDTLEARRDAAPHIQWAGAEVRRSGDYLHLMKPLSPPPTGVMPLHDACVDLPAGLGRIRLLGLPATQPDLADVGLTLRWRVGGETIRLRGQRRSLKQLLQEAGVVPWMRGRVPLVYRDERLVAVGDLFLADDRGLLSALTVRWEDRPRLD